MTTTLVSPAPTACDLCSEPVDLAAQHVTVLRHIERETAIGNVVVEDATVLSVQHVDCTAPVVACACCATGFASYTALSLHRCPEMSAA
jgi:hypothetical protein